MSRKLSFFLKAIDKNKKICYDRYSVKVFEKRSGGKLFSKSFPPVNYEINGG